MVSCAINCAASVIPGSMQRQVAPAVKTDILMMMAGLEGIKGVRDRALLMIGFAGEFRRSELVSLTLADIEQAKQGLIIQLLRSKTDQEGRGRKIAIPYARGRVCRTGCPRPDQGRGYQRSPHFRGVTRHDLISDAALTPNHAQR